MRRCLGVRAADSRRMGRAAGSRRRVCTGAKGTGSPRRVGGRPWTCGPSGAERTVAQRRRSACGGGSQAGGRRGAVKGRVGRRGVQRGVGFGRGVRSERHHDLLDGRARGSRSTGRASICAARYRRRRLDGLRVLGGVEAVGGMSNGHLNACSTSSRDFGVDGRGPSSRIGPKSWERRRRREKIVSGCSVWRGQGRRCRRSGSGDLPVGSSRT